MRVSKDCNYVSQEVRNQSIGYSVPKTENKKGRGTGIVVNIKAITCNKPWCQLYS